MRTLLTGSPHSPAGRPMLADRLARPASGDAELFAGMVDELAAARGPYQFFEAASVRIILSSVRSATAFFNRAFSASSSGHRGDNGIKAC